MELHITELLEVVLAVLVEVAVITILELQILVVAVEEQHLELVMAMQVDQVLSLSAMRIHGVLQHQQQVLHLL